MLSWHTYYMLAVTILVALINIITSGKYLELIILVLIVGVIVYLDIKVKGDDDEH